MLRRGLHVPKIFVYCGWLLEIAGKKENRKKGVRRERETCDHSGSCARRKNRLQYIVRAIDDEIFEETGIRYAYERYIKYVHFDDLFSFTGLYISSHICASGFRRRPDTFFFIHGCARHCMELIERIKTGTFKPRYFPKKQIVEHRKKRNIRPPYFENKTVQKVICELLMRPVLEHSMIYHSDASVSGRGTGKLYDDVEKHLNLANRLYGKDGVVIKVDFSNYFGSIDRKGRLYRMYRKHFIDRRFADFLMLFDDDDTGLSLGNETSQIPASAFTSPIDHYFKDRLGTKCYDRYMDDTIICCHKDEAEGIISAYKGWADEMGLLLRDEKIHVQPLRSEVVFCKEHYRYAHGEYFRLPNPDIERIIRQKISEYKAVVAEGYRTKEWASKRLRAMLNSYRKRPNTTKKLDELTALATAEGLMG